MGDQVTIPQELPLMRTYKFIKLSRFQQQSLIRWKWNFQHHWAQSGPEGTEQAACAGNPDFYDTHHCYTSACHSEEKGKKKSDLNLWMSQLYVWMQAEMEDSCTIASFRGGLGSDERKLFQRAEASGAVAWPRRPMTKSSGIEACGWTFGSVQLWKEDFYIIS